MMNNRERFFRLVMLFVVCVMFCGYLSDRGWAKDGESAVIMDNPDKQQVYSERVLIGMNPGENGVVAYGTTVPPGKRLIIEHISMEADVQAGQFLLIVEAGSSLGSSKALTLVAVYQGRSQDGVRDWFSASQSVKMRLDAGEIVKCFAMRDSWDGNAGIRINLFGYLIDYP